MDAFRGLDKLTRSLNELRDKSAKKIAKAGVNAALRVLADAEKASVNASGASAELKAAARKTIGKRLKKKEGQGYAGKAGFAVGRQSKAKKQKASDRAKDASRMGVGISASNVHWAVLGTKERQTTRGHGTGAMPPSLAGVVQSAAVSAQSGMLEAARSKCAQVLVAEAAKAKTL